MEAGGSGQFILEDIYNLCIKKDDRYTQIHFKRVKSGHLPTKYKNKNNLFIEKVFVI